MDANENPYEILGLPQSANTTSTQIKSAYRKLALKYHPDKVAGSATDKARASQIFTKVGAAYETLSDEERRREYDSGGQGGHQPGGGYAQGGYHPQQGGGGGQGGFMGGFGGGGFDDPFFGGMGHAGMNMGMNMGGMPPMSGRSRGGGGQTGDPFTNPFRLFEQVFADMHDQHNRHHQQGREHYPDGRQSHPQNSRSSGNGGSRQDPFSDPFFGGMGGMMGGMNMGGMGGFENMQQGGSRGNGFSSFSSSSSSFGGGGNRQSVSTTTQMINGKKVTRTERTTMRSDGTMETTVETSGDEDLQRALENSRNDMGGGGGGSRRQLQNGGQSQKNSKSWWKGNQR
mmetsp:Transcript_24602/g.30226  ORF Transcript_24602/g.30226 Transcript_24602/m.30226 type:complete len:342 (+) Transcript_24602:155-1180(+)